MTPWRARGAYFGSVMLVAVVLPLLLNAASVVGASPLKQQPVEMYTGGMSIMLASVPNQQRYAERQDVFRVEPGASLEAEFGFVQTYPEAKQFRVLLLLNYEQEPIGFRSIADPLVVDQGVTATPFGPEDGELHQVMEFRAAPEEERYFRIWTKPLAPGYYDLAMIVVPDPEQNQRELPYWTTARLSTRASVYVGDAAAPPVLDFPLFDPNSQAGSDFSELLWFGQEPYSPGLSASQTVDAGQDVTLTLNYQPYAGNLADDLPSDSPLPAALVAIMDDHVVPINGHPALYGSAVPGRLSWIPITVQVPSEPGVHQLFVQQFPNPYIDVKQAEETGREFFAESSQRFILDAR